MSATLSNTASPHFGPETSPSPTIPNSPTPGRLRLLIAGENSHVRQVCHEVAGSLGLISIEVGTLFSARKALERKDTDILMLDLTPSSIDARGLLTEIKRNIQILWLSR